MMVKVGMMTRMRMMPTPVLCDEGGGGAGMRVIKKT